MIDKNTISNTNTQKRGRGRPPVRVIPANPRRARVVLLMDRWQTETSMSLEQLVDGLTAVPGSSPITRQALGLWATGRSAPTLERAKNGLLLAAPGSWQSRFWREMVEAISPTDSLLTTRILE